MTQLLKEGGTWSSLLAPATEADVAALCAAYEPRLRAAGLLEAVWRDGPDAVPAEGRDTWAPAARAA